ALEFSRGRTCCHAPVRGRRPGSVLLSPLAGASGTGLCRRPFFFGPDLLATRYLPPHYRRLHSVWLERVVSPHLRGRPFHGPVRNFHVRPARRATFIPPQLPC